MGLYVGHLVLVLFVAATIVVGPTIGANSNNGPKWVEQVDTCGGIVVGESGIIRYKVREHFKPAEYCVWMIRANTKSSIYLHVVSAGFDPSCQGPGCQPPQHVSISEWETYGFITPKWRLYRYDTDNLAIIDGPVAVVRFVNRYSTQTNGTGFVLSFTGVGDDKYTDFNFKEYYLEHGTGSVSYPEDPTVDFVPNELVTYLINPKPASTEASSISLKMDSVHVNYTDPSQYCRGNSIRFHSDSSMLGHYSAIGGYYCQESEVRDETFTTEPPGAFVVTAYNARGAAGIKKFKFSWESSFN